MGEISPVGLSRLHCLHLLLTAEGELCFVLAQQTVTAFAYVIRQEL